MTDTVTHVAKLGSFENFQWEVFSESEPLEYNRAKKYVYNLLLDKAKAQDARATAEGKITEAETKAEEAVKAQKKAEKALADSDSTGKVGELTETAAQEKARADKAEAKLLRIEVGDEAGLTIKQSLRLAGETEDELKADAEELVKDFGVKAKADETDEEREEREEREAEEAEENEEGLLRRTPSRLRNPADSRRDDRNDGPQTEEDFAKAVAAASKNRVFG